MTFNPSPKTSVRQYENQSSSSLDQWCQMTSWHGVLDFHLSQNWCSKISWFLVIFVGLFLSINQCASLLLDYTSTDKWVTSVTYESPRGEGLEWPDMTVCNVNSLFRSRLQPELRDYGMALAFVQSPAEDSLSFYDEFQADSPTFLNESWTSKMMLEALIEQFKPLVVNRSLAQVCIRVLHVSFTPRLTRVALA